MWIALSAALTLSSATGPCDLVDKATATALLGAAPLEMSPMGPEPDEDTGSTITYCTIHGQHSAIIVSQMAFKDADAARKTITKEQVTGQMEGDVKKLTEEKGLGDKAYWAYTERGVEYVVIKGANVLAVGLGGALPNPPESYHDALRAAATKAAAKLP